ncbi:hypothetical protein [Fructilactobacillus sanfranciscensis]|uniref:Uncharacterized protein n=1 Tax=Fructilactobacillus sanfranciscensis (strain TMW 1.1304) TaxID=714313 RepID=G2KTF9_FRUST|nr:hypothetical protein [Fructilactobacillus sanfranciscensis]AEN98775.1 hypothetical protein LSA_03200 [Fructilactobacillus sanfranciscensis TMW 1.1304]
MQKKRKRIVWIAFILIFIAMLGLKLYTEKQQQKVSENKAEFVRQINML